MVLNEDLVFITGNNSIHIYKDYHNCNSRFDEPISWPHRLNFLIILKPLTFPYSELFFWSLSAPSPHRNRSLGNWSPIVDIFNLEEKKAAKYNKKFLLYKCAAYKFPSISSRISLLSSHPLNLIRRWKFVYDAIELHGIARV